MSETDKVVAGQQSKAQVLLEHVRQGVSTATELVEVMGVSKARISQLTANLLKQKRLTKRGRIYSLPKTEKFRPDLSPSIASQSAPVKDSEAAMPIAAEQSGVENVTSNRDSVSAVSKITNLTDPAKISHKAAPLTAAERKRRERIRREQEPLSFESPDWRDFLDLNELSRKAGCEPEDRQRIIAKEAMDNACDPGTAVTTKPWTDPGGNLGLCITNDGTGVDIPLVPEIYSPNRCRYSTKRIRRVLRGILGNGARVIGGAVGASGGALIVETRGHRLTLKLAIATGKMIVATDEAIPEETGFTLMFSLGPSLPFHEEDFDLANETLRLSRHGQAYNGPSSPFWYGANDLFRLAQEVTTAVSFRTLCRKCGFRTPAAVGRSWDRPARELSCAEVGDALAQLRACNKEVSPKRLGLIGRSAFLQMPGYVIDRGVVKINDALLPFVLEAWVQCSKPETKGQGRLEVRLIVNRSMTAVTLNGDSTSDGLTLFGCGLSHRIDGPKTGDYQVKLSIIIPYLDLINDGKEPSLKPLVSSVRKLLSKASGVAYRCMERPDDRIRVEDAAWQVMEQGYLLAGDNGRLPTPPRQVMYACRPFILELTVLDKLDDHYFTQKLLPDFIEAHPALTANWNVVFDPRGNFTEPHTKHRVPLGTLAVRNFLAQIEKGAALPEIIDLDAFGLFPSIGPVNRYRDALFIEKEGFGPLLEKEQIAELYDLPIISTKGLSVTALRMLLDRLHEFGVERVFVLHDFDVSGFSILGTLGTSNRRYRFTNKIEVVDLGLRLEDLRQMNLQSEPISLPSDARKRSKTQQARARTLHRHGATPEEIEFLKDRRVELNMMTAATMIEFLKRKLDYHGIRKIIPDEEILRLHLVRYRQWQLAKELLNQHRDELKAKAAAMPIPEDLERAVEDLLYDHPELPWDSAVTLIPVPKPEQSQPKNN
jgi:hypothetical protein